jgi:hypothetical protein
MKHFIIAFLFLIGFTTGTSAQYVLIPMDQSQTNHLKAYSVIYNHLMDGFEAQ